MLSGLAFRGPLRPLVSFCLLLFVPIVDWLASLSLISVLPLSLRKMRLLLPLIRRFGALRLTL